jgi:hypothetical protein
MARVCSICHDPQREKIDHALLNASEGYRSVAKRFGISEPALFRHRQGHLPALIAKGLATQQQAPEPPSKSKDPVPESHAIELARRHQEIETKQARHAIDVVHQLRAVNAICLEVLNKARAADNHSMLLRAVDRIVKQIELQARLLGEIGDGQTVNVAILPEWHGIRQVVLEALRPYPEARLTVAQALKSAGA